MLKTGNFAHVAVRVTNVERAKEFYEKIIGLKKIPRPQLNIPGEWYSVGGNQLHVIGGDQRTSPIDPTGPHMAIEVEDFEAVKATLKEMGIPFLDGDTMQTVLLGPAESARALGRQLWVQDPDGNVIELRKSMM
jgi:glyoxylase I family protein